MSHKRSRFSARRTDPWIRAAGVVGLLCVAVAADNYVFAAEARAAVPAVSGSAGSLAIIAGRVAQSGTPTPGPATSSRLNQESGVAVDSTGTVYIADTGNDVVEKVTPSGSLSIIAGTGHQGAPTPGQATSSDLNLPYGLAVDRSGNVDIADRGNQVVEEVTPSGALSIIAGTGRLGPSTPGPATSSGLNHPYGVAVDGSGNVYIGDEGNQAVVEVTPSGALSIVAGGGNSTPSTTPQSATSVRIGYPTGVAVDASGNVYIADTGNDVVEKVTPSGTLSVIAGDVGNAGAPTPGPATRSDLNAPFGVVVDGLGNLYIADTGNQVVERVTPSGSLSIIGGTGTVGPPTPGPATSSDVDPIGLAVDISGNLYIADPNDDVVEELFDAPRSSPRAPAAPPVLGRTANVAPVSGTVTVELPRSRTFVPLRFAASIPLGTTVDTTHGTVKLTSATDARGHTETGQFYDGEFKITQVQATSAIQKRKRVELTVLTLAGPRPACAATPTASRATAKPKAKPRPKTRSLWGNAHGSYRTIGTNASATVRGTQWLTEDTCSGTLIKVTRGVVSVDDFPHHHSFLLTAPHSFLAHRGPGG